jgi:CarD family transcriptional regulator
MAARKKASKRASRTSAKKTKASAPSTPSRKRKLAAAADSARLSPSATKSKAARPAKAKASVSKAESARRAALAARAAKTVRVAAKAAKPIEAPAPVGGAALREQARPFVDQPAVVVEARSPRDAAAAASPVEATVVVKPSVAPVAKRPPVAAKPGERVEDVAAQKAAKPAGPRQGFKLNEFVVYPAHGVGQIVALENQEVAGFSLELFVINFAKDKMTLRVPTAKVAGVGMRKLSEPEAAKRSLDILTGRARIKRTMWSRRAQEYEAKINSGDINAIAEVVRDLYRSEAQPEQSYSERQLYEAALDRMMREIAAVQKLSEIEALKVIEAQLKRSQRRNPKSETADGDEAAIEEAA